jgi:hypothetical protein
MVISSKENGCDSLSNDGDFQTKANGIVTDLTVTVRGDYMMNNVAAS